MILFYFISMLGLLTRACSVPLRAPRAIHLTRAIKGRRDFHEISFFFNMEVILKACVHCSSTIIGVVIGMEYRRVGVGWMVGF